MPRPATCQILRFLLTAGLLAGCAAPGKGPTPSQLLPASLPTPTARATSRPPTPALPGSPVPTPTAPGLNQVAPWAVARDEEGVWISNPDSSARTRAFETDESSYADAPFAVSPDGRYLAVSSIPIGPLPDAEAYALTILALPSGETIWQLPLFAQEQLDSISGNLPDLDQDDPGFGGSALYARAQVWAALSSPDSLAWSPDGKHLAFIASLDGPSSDLYLLDASTGEFRRLSSGPLQTGHLLWSPDSRHVLHNSISDYNVGRSGTAVTEALWSVDIQQGPPTLLIQGPGFPLAWFSPHLALASMWLWYCDTYNFMILDVPRAEYETIWRGPLLVNRTSQTDFTLDPPPRAFDWDTTDPTLQDCPPPANPPGTVDRSAVPGLPPGAFTSQQPSSIRITVHEGVVSLELLPPTPTLTPTLTPTPRPPAIPLEP